MKGDAMTLEEALRISARATGLAAARGVGLAVAVVDAGGHEFPDHSQNSLPCARVILRPRMVAVQDHLRREAVVLIHVHKCLMVFVVWEHEG